jgi:hypothetical protein
LPGLLLPDVGVQLERVLDTVEQDLTVERLFDEIDGPGLHGPDGHRHVRMAGQDDDGEPERLSRQPFLELKPAHTRQAHIEHKATRARRVKSSQELLGRPKEFYGEADGFNQPAKRVSLGGVIVHDEDRGSCVHAGGLRGREAR